MRHRSSHNESAVGLLDSRLFKFGTKMALMVIVVLVFLTLSQCTVKKPEAPTWSTQLTVPLVNRTYTMSEIIDKMDEEGIGIDAEGQILFSFSEEIEPVALDSSSLSISDFGGSLSEQLGLVDIIPPPAESVSVTLGEIGILGSAVGSPIPATGFSIAKEIDTLSSFTSLTVATGQAELIIGNHIGLDLANATVTIRDVVNDQVIRDQAYPAGFPDGFVDTIPFSLNNMTISNVLEAQLSGVTVNGDTLSTSTGAITAEIDFMDGLTVRSAVAEIPELSRAFAQDVSLGGIDDDPVYGATLAAGSLNLNIANETNLEADLEVTFPDIVNGTGLLTVLISVPPSSLYNDTTVDLTGYELRPADSTAPQDVSILADVSVISSSPEHVRVDFFNQFTVSANLSNLSFSSVTGLISTIETDIPATQEEVDLPDGFDGLELVTSILTIEIENGVQIPGTIYLLLQGDQGQTLNLVRDIAPASADSSVTTVIDTVVTGFLSPIPQVVEVSGSVTFGNNSVGTITTDDYISAQLTVEAPFEIIVNETTIQNDIEREEIDQDDVESITDHMIEGRFIYDIISHLPLGATVNLYLGGDSATLIDDPELLIDGITLLAAPTENGLVNGTISTGYQQIILDNQDIQVIKNNPLFISSEIVLEDSGGEAVRLTTNDYLTIIGRVEVEYLFDGDF